MIVPRESYVLIYLYKNWTRFLKSVYLLVNMEHI